MQPRPIIPHRFARLIAWLCALLTWVAAGAPAHRRRAHPCIVRIRKAVEQVIIITAADHMTPPKRVTRRYGKPPRTLAPMRAIGGAWLRARLRTRGSLIAQAQQLLAVLANRCALARQLVRRRRKHFTRLAPMPARAGAPAPLRAIASAPALPNTS